LEENRPASRYDGGMSNALATILVNGESVEIPEACTVGSLLSLLEMGDRRVAVALNREIVPRSSYASVGVAAGDRVEVLEAVGGG
jgi:sulfur carrier protein